MKTYNLLFLICLQFFALGANAKNSKTKTASSVSETIEVLSQLQPGETLLMEDGVYNDIHLIVKNSGSAGQPISIKAKNSGKVFFTGDVKVELRGEYIILDGIYFKDGDRDPSKWKSHGPGLVAMYGSHNRVTQCAFHAFDQANSAYITTSLTEEGQVPQYCRIDHCSFTEKITFDQVINLNNMPKAIKDGTSNGLPMYHRIDHCFFANPQKPGNAGGGIRVGYWRDDYGRCRIDSNLFMRQDSEAEIITSKSMENVYYANTYLNCRGTLNFRHGDKQVAINNFHIGNDDMYEYGGMFVWGSKHIVACNYFELSRTLRSRGSAALYLNPGAEASEHALAFDMLIANNVFANNNGYAIHFNPLKERRVDYCKVKSRKFEYPHDLNIIGNIFYNSLGGKYTQFETEYNVLKKNQWSNNYATGASLGIKKNKGINDEKFSISKNSDGIFAPSSKLKYRISKPHDIYNIKGIDLDLQHLVHQGIQGKPLTWSEVGPEWLKEIPGTYAKTGKLAPEIKAKFEEVIQAR